MNIRCPTAGKRTSPVAPGRRGPGTVARPLRRTAGAEAGFALPSAIFLLVILALLGAFMAAVASWQHKASADDVQGTRALLAARAGVEWGLHRVAQSGSCAASSTFGFPGSVLSDFTVTVNCTSSAATEAGTAVTVYSLTATACNQPSGGVCPNISAPGTFYIERVWAATLTL